LTLPEKTHQLPGLAGFRGLSANRGGLVSAAPAIGGDMGYSAMPPDEADLVAPVRTVNAAGRGPFAIVVDHASNRIPPHYGDLGLPPSERIRHIAWDPGALAVSLRLSELLDAPVVHATTSRLVVDCNRFLDQPSVMPEISEYTAIPGNVGITAQDRASRIARYHAPYHAGIDRMLEQRRAQQLDTILVCMHSFTPTFMGVARPWPIGLLPAPDEAYTRALFDALRAEAPELDIGWNEPYASGKGVSYTLDHHGAGVEATMIEIRHDEILAPAGVALWAERLARCLEAARLARHPSASLPH
jgi:predicted N-formylglutamate amidohydrolase